jgi:uncharacterized phage protein gp47/JayE
MAGFSAEGLVIPRQPEVVADLIADEKIQIHPNVNTNPDEFLGQFNNVLANSLRLAYEYLEAAYSQTRLSSAVGRGLDEIGITKGISRLLASPSSVDIVLEGINDIYIPSNSLVEDRSTKQRYLTTAAKRILNLSCISIVVNITTSAPSTAFTITINGTPYTRSTPGSGVNMTTTLGLLAGDINTAAIGVTASSTASSVTIVSNTSTNFELTTNSSFSYGTVKSKVNAQSLLKGSVTAATPGDWAILSPIPGWQKTSPIMSTLVTGRDDELDEDYRIRIRTSDGSGGKGTTRAVRIALENTAGVTHVAVEENTTAATVGGIPPYTIHCVVDGGADQDIAKTIWETKGCTTPMLGSQTIVYVDENSIPRTVKFDRPTAVDIDVRITYVPYPEEPTPVDWQTTLKQSVADYINGLGLGLDVIPSKLYVPIYTSVSGIAVILIELKEHSSPTWGVSSITITASQFATVSSLSNITVTL